MHRGLRLPTATGRGLGACTAERRLHAPSCVPAPRLQQQLSAGQEARRPGRGFCQALSDGSSSHNEQSPLADEDSLPQADLLRGMRSLPQCMYGGLASNPTVGFDSDTSRVAGGWDFSEDDGSVPGPSNTPVNEEGLPSSMTLQLWAVAAERAYQERPAIDMLTGRAYWRELNEVYVILFGVGERETEGIYSLRAVTDDGLPQETIIAFEDEEDAQRYAGLLEATMDHLPNVCSIPPQELLHFCIDAGYSCRLEQKGSLLIPPDFNVGVTDWERSLRLREGHWSVLEEEPALQRQRNQRTLYASDTRQGPLALPAGNAPRIPQQQQQPGAQQQQQAQDLPAVELETIRAQLERLLDREL